MATRRTNRGVIIDLDALMSKASPNEPAVGNMGVNAKGDVLGKEGRIVKKNEERVREHYKKSQRQSNQRVSLKGNESALKPDDSATTPEVSNSVSEPEEFAAPEDVKPLGYKEVELDNGDIQMVPYYKEEDAE